MAIFTKLAKPQTYNNLSDDGVRFLYNRARAHGIAIPEGLQARIERMGNYNDSSDAKIRFLKDQTRDNPHLRPPNLQQRIDDLPSKPVDTSRTNENTGYDALTYNNMSDESIRSMRDLIGDTNVKLPPNLQRRFARLPKKNLAAIKYPEEASNSWTSYEAPTAPTKQVSKPTLTKQPKPLAPQQAGNATSNAPIKPPKLKSPGI